MVNRENSLRPVESINLDIVAQREAVNPETEIAPEVIEQIMAKVEDINRPGIGFSTIFDDNNMGLKKLDSVLRNGLLGHDGLPRRYEALISGNKPTHEDDHPAERGSSTQEDAAIWARKTKEQKDTIVFFNITGRVAESDPNNPAHRVGKNLDIQQSYYLPEGQDSITILFKLDSFKEITPNTPDDPYKNTRGRYQNPKTSSYRIFTVEGEVEQTQVPSSEHGFTLWHRVAPKKFTGIYLQTEKAAADGQEAQTSTHQIETDDQIKIQNRVDSIVAEMIATNKNKPGLYLPIYGHNGNLLWPKQMSYKEIQRFVQQKENKNK